MAATDEEIIAQLQLEIAQLKLQNVRDRALFSEELTKAIAENTTLKADLAKKDNEFKLRMAARDNDHAEKDTEMFHALLATKGQRKDLIAENTEVAWQMEALQKDNAKLQMDNAKLLTEISNLHEKLAEAEANLNDVLTGGKPTNEKSLVKSFGRPMHEDYNEKPFAASFGRPMHEDYNEKPFAASFSRLMYEDNRPAARHSHREELRASGQFDQDLQRSLRQAPNFMLDFGRPQHPQDRQREEWGRQDNEF